jgi:ABC-type molybdate transport system substrate-binding protein
MQKVLKVFVVLSILTLALSAFAGENKGSFTLPSTAQLEGKSLAAGEYKVRWEGTGPEVQVTVTQGKNTIATLPARLVERSEKARRNAVVVNNSGSASHIIELQLAGKQAALVFGSEASVAQKQAQ